MMLSAMTSTESCASPKVFSLPSTQGLTTVPVSAQIELTLPPSAQRNLTLSPKQPKLTRRCVPKVLKLSSNVGDVVPKVLKLGSE